MKFKRKLLQNIYFDTPTEGGGAGNPTPAPTEIEVPGYINDYVNGMEEGDQKGYISEMLKDQRGIDALKGFIKDPNAEWNIDTTAFKDKVEGVDEFIQEMKNNGYSQKATEKLIQNRIEMLEREKAAMTPEELAAGENIANFIASEESDARKAVYQRMSEYAEGRRMLLEFMALKSGKPTPGVTQGSATTVGAYDHETFIEAYNYALDKKDNAKLQELKSFALSKKEIDSFYSDFMFL